MSNQKKKASAPIAARSHVAVAVRVRPLNNQEKGDSIVIKPNEVERSVAARSKNFYGFDRVYGIHSSQAEIYSDLVKRQVDDVLKGYNCTLFAYGQTGTGKTYTMEGGEGALEGNWETDEATGIIPRSAQHIFAELSNRTGIEFIVRLSYVEIYNEEMVDLLSSSSSTEEKQLIRLFEDPAKKGSIVISGAEEVPVRCRDDVYRLLKQGTEKRRTAETLMNKRSSRSHSVLTISVLIRESLSTGEELVKQGKLRLVDLAGSENIARSGAEGKRAKEAGNINTSLLALGRVINALTTNAPHVPYRESKLTRLLQDSLGGSSITTIIATLSPANSSFEESLSTLEYAHRAMNIKNKPEINENVNKKDLFKEYSGTIDRLLRELKAAREKNGVYLDQELYDEMGKKIETSEEQIANLEQQLADTLEAMRKHLSDLQLMDDLYGQAYVRVKELETRLAERLVELEEEKMAMALEKMEHEKTRRALDRSRLAADSAFERAEENRRVGQEGLHELRRLHARTDCIQIMGTENREKALEMGESIASDVPPMREANRERMARGEEMMKTIDGATATFKNTMDDVVPATRTAIDSAATTMESLTTRLSSLDLEYNEGITARTSTLVKEIESGKISLNASIAALLIELDEEKKKMEERVVEVERMNEELRKEMEGMRADYRESIGKVKEARRETREEMEKQRRDIMDKMTSFLASAASLDERLEASQMEEEEKMGETIVKMGEIEMGWSDQMDEILGGMKDAIVETTEKRKEEISSCLPTISAMATTTADYCRLNGEKMEEWKKKKSTVEEEAIQKHTDSITSALSSIDSLFIGYSECEEQTKEAVNNTRGILSSSTSAVEADLLGVEKIVRDTMQKIVQIPSKDISEVYREMEDVESPPTEEELYGEDEEEERGAGGENDENAENAFSVRAKLRRSRFKVRDSILDSRNQQLQSPARLLQERQRIDEENDDSGRD